MEDFLQSNAEQWHGRSSSASNALSSIGCGSPTLLPLTVAHLCLADSQELLLKL